MLLVVAVSAAVTLTSSSFLVVEPLYARHVLHRPPSQFALFEAAAGTGAILSGLAVSRIRARARLDRANPVHLAALAPRCSPWRLQTTRGYSGSCHGR